MAPRHRRQCHTDSASPEGRISSASGRTAVSRELGLRWQIVVVSAGCSAGGRSSRRCRWGGPRLRALRLSARRRQSGSRPGARGTLDPANVPKYRTPLLIPPVMPRAARIPLPGGKPADYYEISMRQIRQQILPAVSGHDGVGLWRCHDTEEEGAPAPQRAIADDRGRARPASAHQVDQ